MENFCIIVNKCRRYEERKIIILENHFEKFKQYNMMLYVKLPKQMLDEFKRLYSNKTSAMHVAWSIDDKDNIRFHAAIGNNILLLLDSLLSKEWKKWE